MNVVGSERREHRGQNLTGIGLSEIPRHPVKVVQKDTFPAYQIDCKRGQKQSWIIDKLV